MKHVIDNRMPRFSTWEFDISKLSGDAKKKAKQRAWNIITEIAIAGLTEGDMDHTTDETVCLRAFPPFEESFKKHKALREAVGAYITAQGVCPDPNKFL